MDLKRLYYVAGSTLLFNLALLPSASAETVPNLHPLTETNSNRTKSISVIDVSNNTKLTETLPFGKQNDQVVKPVNSTASVLQKLDKLQLQELQPQSNVDTVSQVNSVSQLSDVRATDWAFTSLQSLVERYGCIAGFPNNTYRGKQSISRYEFAAGMPALTKLMRLFLLDLLTR